MESSDKQEVLSIMPRPRKLPSAKDLARQKLLTAISKAMDQFDDEVLELGFDDCFPNMQTAMVEMHRSWQSLRAAWYLFLSSVKSRKDAQKIVSALVHLSGRSARLAEIFQVNPIPVAGKPAIKAIEEESGEEEDDV